MKADRKEVRSLLRKLHKQEHRADCVRVSSQPKCVFLLFLHLSKTEHSKRLSAGRTVTTDLFKHSFNTLYLLYVVLVTAHK